MRVTVKANEAIERNVNRECSSTSNEQENGMAEKKPN